MKRLLILIGLPMAFLVMPHQVHAENHLDFSCETLEEIEDGAISTYAKKVLERADNGISYAEEAGTANDFLSILPGWTLSIASAWAGLTDTMVQRTQTVEELANASACLQFDVALIHCKMEKVRNALQDQTERGSFIAIIRLTSLLEFLNERLRFITIGALDPQFGDPTWGYRYAFDRPSDSVWCASQAPENRCEQKSEVDCIAAKGTPYETEEACVKSGALPPLSPSSDNGRLCPFDSNYAPAFQSGFGCDIETIQSRAAFPPIQSELEGLRALSGALVRYRKTAQEVREFQQEMDEMLQGPQSTTIEIPIRTHLQAYGCGWTGGWCDDDITKRCASDVDCEDTCIFSNKVCKNNRAIRCTNNAQCGQNDECVEGNEPSLRSIRGNFSFDRDQLSILQDFLNVRSQQEISRIFRSDIQTASEIPETKPQEREKRAKEDSDPAYFLWRTSIRLAVQTWSRIQARGESMIFPDIDAPLETSRGLSDLHANISEIARIASSKTGLRDFVTRYGWFLRRSCIYRSCNSLLEQTLRIVTTDACFPYTNGMYLKDNPDNPRWEQCKDAAGIE